MTRTLLCAASLSCGISITLILLVAIRQRQTLKNSDVDATSLPKPQQRNRLLEYLQHLIRAFTVNSNSRDSRRFMTLTALCVSTVLLILTLNAIFTILGGVGTYYGLKLYSRKKEDQRAELFNEQLIEGLGIIINAVAAGQSLMQALDTLVKNTQPPLSESFAEVLRRSRLGTPLSEALNALSHKHNNRDLRIAVLSLNLAKESGGNMGEIVSRLADTMRERKKIQGKIKSLTAQGKASGVVMSCVPFLLLIVLYFMEPEIMGLLFTTIAGNVMLALVCIMVSLGAFFIDRITKIDI